MSERSNSVLNFGGVKVHAALLDRILRSTRGIREAITFKNPKVNAPDEVFAFVIYEDGVNQIQAAETARIRVEELMGPVFAPKVIRGVSGLPRHADGTADRQACAKLILEISAAKTTTRN